MSYCRWSSDNWRSDLYCYEGVGDGFVTHVAANRIVGDIPQTPPFGSVSMAEWMAAYSEQRRFLATAKREPIGLPHDGESFYNDDLAGMLARMKELQALGYHVPASAIAAAEEELADLAEDLSESDAE